MEQATEVLRKSLLSFEKISFPVPSIKLSFNWIAPYKHYIFFFLYSNLKDGRDCVVFDTQKGTTNIIKTGLEAFEKANSSLCYWKDNIFVLYGGLVFGQSEGSQGIKFLSVIDIGGRISFRIQTCKPAGEERPDKDHHAHIYRDKMYIIGNKKKSVQFETIPTFDLNTRTWAEQPITKDIPEPCQNPTSVLFKGKIYFFGGTTPPPPEDVQAQAKEDMKPQAKEDVKLQQTAGSGTLSNIFSGGEGARPGSLFGNKESTGGSSLFGSQTGAGGSCPLSFATKMGSTGGSSLFGSQTGAGGSGPLSFATKMGSTGGSDLLSFATKMGSTGGSSLFGSQTGVGGSGLLANATNKGSIGGSSLFSKRVALDLFVLDLETMEWQQIHKQSFLPTCPTSIRDHFFAEVFGDKVFISHRNFMQSFIYDPANNNTLNSEGLSFKDQWRVRSFGEHSLLFRTLIEKDSSWLEYHNLAQPEKQEEKVTTSQQLSEPQPEKKEEKVTPSQQLSEPQPEKKEEKVTPSQQLSEPQPEKQEEKVTASQQPSEPQPEKKEEKVAPYQKPPEIKEKPSAERNESRLQAHSEILRRSLLSFRKAPFPRVELTYTAAYKHFLIIFPLSRLPDGADCVVLDTENGTTQTLQTGLQLQQRFDKGFCYWKDNIFVFYGGLFSETYSRRNANEDLDVHLLYVIENEGKISFETKSCHLTDPKWWANFRVIHIYQDNMYILNTRRSTHHEVLNKFDLNKEEWSECQTTGEIPTYDNRDTPKTVLLNGKIYVSAPKVEEAISRGGGSSLFGNRNPESWVLFALDLENYKWQQIHKDSSIPREIKIGWSSKVVGDRIFKSHQDYDEFWIYNPANNQVSKSEGFPGREEWEIESSKSHLIIFRFTGDSTRKEIEYQNIAISAQSQEEEEKSLLSDPLVASYQQLPHMEYIWKEKPFADITFVVGTEEISAHRAILLKYVIALNNLRIGGMIEATSNKITVPDISSVNFKAILEYIYCDKIALTEALAMELIILADMYSLPNLKADCEKFLSEKLSVSNFVEVMKVSQTADSEKLEKRIVSFLTSNIEKVKQEIDISVIPPELFIKAIVDLKSNKR